MKKPAEKEKTKVKKKESVENKPVEDKHSKLATKTTKEGKAK